MNKILFCLQTMTLGGVEKELITVLKKIHSNYDVTVLLLHLEDLEIIKEIPIDVKLKVLDIQKDYYYASTLEIIKQRIKRGKLIEAFEIGIKRCCNIGVTGSNLHLDDIPNVDEDFDVAICYHIHSPLAFRYVAEKIQARKKIAWIHNDFFVTGYPIQRLRKYINKYDEFISVSKKVEKEFRTLCPWYKGGISTAYNYLDEKDILKLSNECVVESTYLHEMSVKILTVGRFTEQKGIDLAIEVASMLKESNLKFHWFVIGYGELESTFKRLISEKNICDCFTLLGKKKNPYPYMKLCDIYVQPSRHEAFPLVIMEAKILNRPIICTNFDGADEQIINGRNGVIVPVNDVNALFAQVSKLIQYPELRNKLSSELAKWCTEDDLKEIIKHFE